MKLFRVTMQTTVGPYTGLYAAHSFDDVIKHLSRETLITVKQVEDYVRIIPEGGKRS